MRVVELADEFELTSAEALDVCRRAGIPADGGGTVLSPAEAEAFRRVAAAPPAPAPPAPVASPAGPPAASHAASAAGATNAVLSGSRSPNVWAIAAFASAFLPIVGLWFGFGAVLFVFPAIYLGRAADRHARRQPGPYTTSGLALAARFIAIGLAVLALGSIVLFNVGAIEKRPSEWIQEVLTGRRAVFDAADQPAGIVPIKGSCVVANGGTTPRGVLLGVAQVACTAPHDAQVLHVFTKASVDKATRNYLTADDPTAPEVAIAVLIACEPDLAALVAANPATAATAKTFVILPSPHDWSEQRDPLLGCAVGLPSGRSTTAWAITP